ncbi:MAG: hypothetical protein ACYCV7_04430 [Acidimicrobiales bacterium]
MKLRIGTIAAFGLGYVFGARAGRGRYHQIVQVTGRLRRSTPVAVPLSAVADKAKAAAMLGAVRAKDSVTARLGWSGPEITDTMGSTVLRDIVSAVKVQRVLTDRSRRRLVKSPDR